MDSSIGRERLMATDSDTHLCRLDFPPALEPNLYGKSKPSSKMSTYNSTPREKLSTLMDLLKKESRSKQETLRMYQLLGMLADNQLDYEVDGLDADQSSSSTCFEDNNATFAQTLRKLGYIKAFLAQTNHWASEDEMMVDMILFLDENCKTPEERSDGPPLVVPSPAQPLQPQPPSSPDIIPLHGTSPQPLQLPNFSKEIPILKELQEKNIMEKQAQVSEAHGAGLSEKYLASWKMLSRAQKAQWLRVLVALEEVAEKVSVRKEGAEEV